MFNLTVTWVLLQVTIKAKKSGKVVAAKSKSIPAKKAVRSLKGKARLVPTTVQPVQPMVIPEDSSESERYSSDEEDIEDQIDNRTIGKIPNVPITSHVSDKVKKKIASGKYFNFKQLLPTLDDNLDDNADKKMTRQQWIDMEEKNRYGDRRGNKELTIMEWLRCYHTFMSLRLQTAPTEIQGLLRHAEIVQDLHQMGKDAVKYDALFRRTKDQHPFIGWGEYMAEIVIKLPMRPRFGQLPNYRPSGQGFSRPASFGSGFPTQRPGFNRYGFRPCTRFNSAAGCHIPNCTYQHKCLNCGKVGHSALRCFQRKRQN